MSEPEITPETTAEPTTTEPTEGKPATPPPTKVASLEERLAKAERSAARRREQATLEAQQRKALEEKLQGISKEHELTRGEVEKIRQLRERAAEGDDDAIAELLGFDFDTLTRLKLDPESTRDKLKAKRGQTELEKQLEELRQWKQAQEERERTAAVESEKAAFLQTAEQLAEELPDLQILERDTLLTLAGQIAPAWLREKGRAPTFRELAQAVAAHVEPYHRRIFEVYSKKAAPPPPPKKNGTAAPSTVTGASATVGASENKPLTAEERRQAALAKARELLG